MSEFDAHRLEKATRDAPIEATPTSVPAIPHNTVQHYVVDTHNVVDTSYEYTGTDYSIGNISVGSYHVLMLQAYQHQPILSKLTVTNHRDW